MKQKQTLCQVCMHARRASGGYVEACGAPSAKTPPEIFGQCVEASLSGQCRNFAPRDLPGEQTKIV